VENNLSFTGNIKKGGCEQIRNIAGGNDHGRGDQEVGGLSLEIFGARGLLQRPNVIMSGGS